MTRPLSAQLYIRLDSHRYMPEALHRIKANSMAGLSVMWKCADPLSATLMLGASAVKDQPLLLAGKSTHYTTGHRSVARNTQPPNTKQWKPTWHTATVAMMVMARGTSATQEELAMCHDRKQQRQLLFMLLEAYKQIPKQAVMAVQIAPEDDSPDVLGMIMGSPELTRRDLKHARDAVSAYPLACTLYDILFVAQITWRMDTYAGTQNWQQLTFIC